MQFVTGFLVGLSLLLLGSGSADPGAQLIRNTGPSIALLHGGRGAGTGFLLQVGPALVLVTNAHVCAAGGPGGYLIAEFDWGTYPVKVLAADAGRDLCLLTAPGGHGLHLAANQHEADPLWVYGHAFAAPRVLSHGYVSAAADRGWLYTSIPVFPGNSGSPVLDAAGEVVGVAVATDPRSNYGYIIPLVTLQQFLKDAELVN